MSKYYSGEELNDKMIEMMPSIVCTKYGEREQYNRAQIDAFAAWAKIPKPAPPSFLDVYQQWEHDYGGTVGNASVGDLALRLAAVKAQHEEYERE